MKRLSPLLAGFLCCFALMAARPAAAGTLYWDAGAGAGLQAGSGVWSTSGTNWNTAADGSGSRVAWTNGSDAVFSADGNSEVTVSGSVTVGNLTFSGRGYRVDGTGLTLAGSSCTIAANRNATISAPIAGSGGIVKSGTALLVLAGSNSYIGTTAVTAGELRLGLSPSEEWNADALTGGSGSAVTAWAGSVSNLTTAAYGTAASPTLSPSSFNGHNAITVSGSNGLQVSASNSPVSGAGDFSVAVVFRPKVNAGSGGNAGGNWFSYTGIVDAEQGGGTYDWGLVWSQDDKVGGGLGLPDTTVWSGSSVALNLPHVAVYTVRSGTMQIALDGAASAFTVGGTNTRNAALFSIGCGTGPARYFSGDIADIQIFNAGLPAQAVTNLGNRLAVAYGASANFGVSGGINGGYLPPTTYVTVAAGATLNLNDNNLSVGAVSGSGTVLQGLGTLTVTGTTLYWDTAAATGLQTGSGVWSTSSATWNTAADGSGSMVPWTNGCNAVFSGDGNSEVTVSGSVAVGNMTFSGSGYRVDGGALTLAGTSSVITANQPAIVSAAIVGTGGIVKSGTGALVLAGSNTYAGATTVNAGELRLGINGTCLPPGTVVTVSAGATLNLNDNNLSLASLSGSGVVQTGLGTLTLGGDGSSSTMDATLFGSGGFVKSGTGTLTLNGSIALGGTTTISQGTLLMGAAGVNITGPVSVSNGATLAVPPATAGLPGRYYNIAPQNVGGSSPNFSTLATFESSIAALTPALIVNSTAAGTNFDFGSNGAAFPAPYNSGATNFEVEWAGQYLAPATGIYTFDTGSDDGSILSIDGQSVVANNFFQGVTVRSGTVALASGIHTIAIGYYQGTGGYGFYADVTLPNGGMQRLANASLSHGISTVGPLATASNSVVQLNGGTLIVYSSGNTALAGTVSGTGTLSLTQSGTVSLTGAVAGTISTTITDATLLVSNGGAISGGITDNGTLVFSNSTAQTYAGAIVGIGSLNLIGSAALTLTGTNPFAGLTTISAGSTLQLGNGSFNGMLSGDIVDNGGLLVNAVSAESMPGILSGTGTLTKSGASKLTLSNNTLTGATTVSAGTIAYSSNATSAATLAVSANTTIQAASTLSLSSYKTISVASGATLTIDSNGLNLSVPCNITGSGALTKIGNGLLTLSGSNNYSGTTTVSSGTLELAGASNTTGNFIVNGGVLQIDAGALPASGTITLNTNGALASVGAYTTANAWLASGRIAISSAGAIALPGNGPTNESINLTQGSKIYSNLSLGATGSLTYLGTLTPVSNTYRLGGGSGTLTYAPVLSGNSSLSVAQGSVRLTGNNTYTGSTTISGGTVLMGNNNVFGSGTLTLSGGVLDVNNNTLSKAVMLTSRSTLKNSGIGVGTVSGAISGSNQDLWIQSETNSTLNITGKITARYVNPWDAGLVILNPTNGPNVFTTLEIDAGPVRANDGWGLPTNCRLRLVGGVFETGANLIRNLAADSSANDGKNVVTLVGNSPTSYWHVGFSACGGPATINLGNGATLDFASTGTNGLIYNNYLILNDANADNTLTIVNPLDLDGAIRTFPVYSGTAVLSGNIINSSTTTSGLTKLGNGKLILAGSNSYTGPTTLTAGTLQFNSPYAIGGTGQTLSAASATTLVLGYPIDNAFLNRLVSPAGTAFTIALAVSSSNNLDFNSTNGAILEAASLGAQGNVTYSGNLTPCESTYRLGGGGGTLTMANALSGSNSLFVGGFAPYTSAAAGAFASNGTVILSSSNSFTGSAVVLNPGVLMIGGGVVPGTPSDLVAGMSTSTSATLTWISHSNNETGFQIDASTDGVNFTQIGAVGATVTTYAVTGLSVNSIYYFRVRAINGATTGFNSNVAVFSTQTPVLTAPTPTSATGDYKWVDLEWKDNATGHKGIVIQASPDNVTFTEMARVPATGPKYYSAYIGVTQTTWFRLAAYDFDGNIGPWSGVLSATTNAEASVEADLQQRFGLGPDSLPPYNYSNPTFDYSFTDAQKATQRANSATMFAALQAALSDTTQTTYTIVAGDYRLSANGITIANRVNFTVNTTGTVNFYYEGTAGGTVFVLQNCSNFTLKGPFVLDAETLSYTEGQIINYDPVGGTVDIDIPMGYSLFAPSTAASNWVTRVFNSQGGRVGNWSFTSFSSLGGRRVRIGGMPTNSTILQPGCIATIPGTPYYNVFTSSGCTNMVYSDMYDYTGDSGGVLNNSDKGNSTYNNFRSVPKPGTNRLYSAEPGNQGFVGGTVSIIGCAFDSGGDDGISISWDQGVVALQTGPRTIVIGGLSLAIPWAGAPLGFYSWGEYQPEGNATVVTITPVTDAALNNATSAWMLAHGSVWTSAGLYQVTLDRDVTLTPYAQFFNLSAGNDRLIVRNCYFKDMTGPGIQYKAARESEIVDNLLVRNPNRGIQPTGAETYWQEGKWDNNILVRNNVIRDCGNPIDATVQRDYPSVLSYLMIDGNTIINPTGNAVQVTGGYGMETDSGVTVTRNVIINPSSALFSLTGVTDAIIADNLVEYGAAIPVAPLSLNANVDIATLAVSNNQGNISFAQTSNEVGAAADGATFSSAGGLGGTGMSFSATLLGGTLIASGATFTFGATGSNNAIRAIGQPIALAPGNYTDLYLLAAATNGNQPNQTFTVTYADGSSQSFTRSISDWTSSQNYTGETIAKTMSYRDQYNGTALAGTCYLYRYDLALDPTRTVAYLTLPNNSNVNLLGVTLQMNVPTPPNLTAAPVSDTRIDLAWVDDTNNETGFDLDQATDSCFEQNVVSNTLFPGTTTFSATGLSASTTYYFRLHVSTPLGISDDAFATATTDAGSLFTVNADVGSPILSGSGTYAPPTAIYTVSGGGANPWTASDQFHYYYTPYTGDGSLVGMVLSLTGTAPAAMAGVMFRNDTSANAAFAAVVATPGNGVAFQWRNVSGAASGTAQIVGVTAPVWLKLVRSGSNFAGYYSVYGSVWIQIASPQTLAAPSAALAGLAVTSQDSVHLATATFGNVKLFSQAAQAAALDPASIGLPNAWAAQYGIGTGPLGDPSHSGLPNLMAYALGLNPNAPNRSLLPFAVPQVNAGDSKTYLTLSYRQRIGGGGLTYSVEVSPDLRTWNPGGAFIQEVGAPVANPDGITETETVRLLPSLQTPGATKSFMRLKVSFP